MKFLKQQIFLFSFLLTAVFLVSCGNDTINNSGGNTTGNTDTSFSNYIIVTPGNDTLIFTDNNAASGFYSDSSNITFCYITDSVSNASLSLGFTGHTTGNPAFIPSQCSLEYFGTWQATSIQGTVTYYGAVGSVIKGTFNGTYVNGPTTYSGHGTFTVRRIQ